MLLGDRALETALRAAAAPSEDPIAENDRALRYPSLAEAAQAGRLVGSFAGGEQPKFLASVRRPDGTRRAVLVKFSSATPSPASRRWSDLLCCEHLAAETLRTAGLPAANTQFFSAGGRSFLEVERFDRTPAHGRRGILSLEAVEEGWRGTASPDWAAASANDVSAAWLDRTDARLLRWLWCFGDLIANNDMHRGNASLLWDAAPPFRLAPSYDMLPMLYAPGSQGDLSARSFAPRPPLPSVADVWPAASAAALAFWSCAAEHPLLSDDWRHIASRNHAVVDRLR